MMAANKMMSSNVNLRYVSRPPVFYWRQLPPELSELINSFIQNEETIIFEIKYDIDYPFTKPVYKLIYYKGVFENLVKELIDIYNKRGWEACIHVDKDIILFATLFNETITNESLSLLL